MTFLANLLAFQARIAANTLTAGDVALLGQAIGEAIPELSAPGGVGDVPRGSNEAAAAAWLSPLYAIGLGIGGSAMAPVLAFVDVIIYPGVDPTGATDSAAAILAGETGTATNGQTLWFGAGTYLYATQEATPSDLSLRLGPKVTINQQLVGGHGIPQTAFLYAIGTQRGTANGTIHTTPAYNVDNPTVSVDLATEPLVGNALAFVAAGASKGGVQLYTITAVAGGATPWTVTFARPIVFPFVAGDTVIEYSAKTTEITVDGLGAVGSGTGDQQWEFAYGSNIFVSRLNYNLSTGAVTGAVGGMDIGLVSVEAQDCECDATGIPIGYYMQSTERGIFTRMRAKGATNYGIVLLDTFSSGLVDCWAFGCLTGTPAGIQLGRLNANFPGCLQSYVQGGGAVDCHNGLFVDFSVDSMISDWSSVGHTNYGVFIASTSSKTFLSNVSSTSGVSGFLFASETEAKNLDCSHNTTLGILSAPGAGNFNSIDGVTCDMALAQAPTAIRFDSGTTRLKNARVTSAVAGGPQIYCLSATRVDAEDCYVNMTSGGGARGYQADAGILNLSGCKAAGGAGIIGVYVNGGTVNIGPGCDFDSCAVPVDIIAGTITMIQTGGNTSVAATRAMTFAEHYTTVIEMTAAAAADSTLTTLPIPGMMWGVHNPSAHTLNLKTSTAATVAVTTGKQTVVAIDLAGDMIEITALL